MKCSIQGCTGSYEQREIVRALRHQGQVVVIEQVPVEVCSVCGDILLEPKTVRRIEEMLRARRQPTRSAPLYEYSA